MQIENSRCTNFLRDYISIFGGQYLVYHNGDTGSSSENWKERWDKEIVKAKKFYIVGSGNDGDYNDELLIEIDDIFNFFENKNIDTSNVVFLTSNNKLNYGLDILKKVTEKNGIRKITLKYVHDNKICGFYFYDRNNGSISAAKGDLSIHINNIILSFDKPNTSLRLK